jgi:hypothetical protein
VLRVETTINHAADFKSFRTPEAVNGWHQMREGIADLQRRAETSQAANNRCLRTLASVEKHHARLMCPACSSVLEIRPWTLAPARIIDREQRRL